MSIISQDKINSVWNNAGGGFWVDSRTGDLAYNVGHSELQSSSNKISDAGSELRNRIIMFQGLVMELQRRAGKTEKFDRGLYGEINQANKALDDLTTQLKILMEQIEYTKDIVEAIKVSQELADGFEKPKEYKIDIDAAKIAGAMVNNMPVIHTTMPTHTPMQIDANKYVNSTVGKAFNDTLTAKF